MRFQKCLPYSQNWYHQTATYIVQARLEYDSNKIVEKPSKEVVTLEESLTLT